MSIKPATLFGSGAGFLVQNLKLRRLKLFSSYAQNYEAKLVHNSRRIFHAANVKTRLAVPPKIIGNNGGPSMLTRTGSTSASSVALQRAGRVLEYLELSWQHDRQRCVTSQVCLHSRENGTSLKDLSLPSTQLMLSLSMNTVAEGQPVNKHTSVS